MKEEFHLFKSSVEEDLFSYRRYGIYRLKDTPYISALDDLYKGNFERFKETYEKDISNKRILLDKIVSNIFERGVFTSLLFIMSYFGRENIINHYTDLCLRKLGGKNET